MVSGEVVTQIVVLAVGQLIALKATQHATPRLYFATSSLFSSRDDVRGAAVLARLAIPFLAGCIAHFLSDDSARAAAWAAGIAWFLAIWPVIWNPSLLERGWHPALIAVVLAFQCAFVALAVAGVTAASVIEAGLTGEAPVIQQQYAWAVATSLPLSAVAAGLSKLAGRRVTFADSFDAETKPDDLSETDDESTTAAEWIDWLLEAPHISARRIPAALLLSGAIAVVIRRSFRRPSP